MKKTIAVLVSSLALPAVLADAGDVMGPGMMWGYGTSAGWTFGMGLLSLVFWALAAFLFSVIFWLTHNWLVKGKHK